MYIKFVNHCLVALLELMVLICEIPYLLEELLIDFFHLLYLLLKSPSFGVSGRRLVHKLRDFLFEHPFLVGGKNANLLL